MSIELTAKEKLELAVKKARETRKQAKDEAQLELLTNGKYIDYLAKLEDEQEDMNRVQAMLDTANKMKSITTNEGTKYNVHCYPVAEYIFGPVAGRILGLITGSSAMFTEERQTEFEAITEVPYLAFTKAREAIGSPAYYNKGEVHTQIEPNADDIKPTVTAILQMMELDVAYADRLSEDNINKWFKVSEAKAKEKLSDHEKTQAINASAKFTLEDA